MLKYVWEKLKALSLGSVLIGRDWAKENLSDPWLATVSQEEIVTSGVHQFAHQRKNPKCWTRRRWARRQPRRPRLTEKPPMIHNARPEHTDTDIDRAGAARQAPQENRRPRTPGTGTGLRYAAVMKTGNGLSY